MTVHVIIPVYNRLPLTRLVIDCLRAQQLDEALRIIVIDDGSTDGTAQWLAGLAEITVLKGDGSLWWAGAIELGLRHVLQTAGRADWVLFCNNDTTFDKNFIRQLLEIGYQSAPVAVGSAICDSKDTERLLSIGPLLDSWRLKISDKLGRPRIRNRNAGPHTVDALSGRGTIYPVSAFQAIGCMKPLFLPHYLADYELSVRVRKAGYELLVSEDAVVFSNEDFGNSYNATNLWRRFFEIRSPHYLPATLAFWWRVSTFIERLTLLPRFLWVTLKPKRFLRSSKGR
jgi:GT2 family glycosyltransferase